LVSPERLTFRASGPRAAATARGASIPDYRTGAHEDIIADLDPSMTAHAWGEGHEITNDAVVGYLRKVFAWKWRPISAGLLITT
jgi:hypothetical protein